MTRSTPRTSLAAILVALSATLPLIAGCGLGSVTGDDDTLGGDRAPSALPCSAPGTNLQAVLDAGKDLALCPGAVYALTARLQYKATGQTISTAGAKHPRDYATLRLAGAAVSAIYSHALDNVVLEKVIVDGNRQALGAFTGPATANFALVLMVAAKGQIVRNTVLKNTRTWSSLQLHEGSGQCQGGLVENNVVLWAGCDARGNGCAPGDPPQTWGDGISMPCRATVVRNNLVIDATDVGIVLFGAPGSTVEGNHVAAVSRETFGGVALVDVMDLYAVSGSKAALDAVTDYRADQVRDNRLSATGSRVHIGVAVGPPIWFGPTYLNARTLGVSVTQNSMDGQAFGYGVVANGCDQVTIQGNSSSATHGGSADGVNGAAAAPRAFLYNPSTTTNPVTLQGEFVADQALTSLLRLNSCPQDSAGFRRCGYTSAEAGAIVRLAYIEILGREPDAGGASQFAGRMLKENLSADALRREMMASTEFKQANPGVAPSAMQTFRQAVWEKALLDLLVADLTAGQPWPKASALYDRALKLLAARAGTPAPPGSNPPGSNPPPQPPPSSACNPTTQPAPHWGVKSGACLPSCGALGGTSSSAAPCAQIGKVDAGAAYDVPYCCKAPSSSTVPIPAAVSAYLDKMYQQILKRAADAAGKAYWAGVYATIAPTCQGLTEAFLTDPAAKGAIYSPVSDTAFLQNLYQALLWRPADAGGLNAWLGQLTGGKLSRAAVVQSFINSAEFAARCTGAGLTSK